MKSNISLTTVLVLAMSSNVFAGPKVNLLNTGAGEALALGTASLTKMTSSGVAEFQNFRNYARLTWTREYETRMAAQGRDGAADYANGLVSGLNHDRSLTVLAPTVKDGKNTALLQRMDTDDTGKLVRTAFEIPATHEKPTSISLSNVTWNMNSGFGDTVAVKRSFDLPSSADGKLELTNMMVIRQLEDGKTYRLIVETEVKMGDRIAEVSILSNHFHPREIDVSLKRVNPDKNDFRNPVLYQSGGKFKLPDEIKGQVVEVNINAIGTRLTLRTSEGVEYVYSIEKKDASKLNDYQRDYDPLQFTLISKTKLPGGVNSLLASTKVYPGRASAKEPVRGMEVESAADSAPVVR